MWPWNGDVIVGSRAGVAAGRSGVFSTYKLGGRAPCPGLQSLEERTLLSLLVLGGVAAGWFWEWR